MKFREACSEAAKMAKEENRVVYLYQNKEGWFASKVYWRDWLFKAYPGGRKIFSTSADRFLNS